MKKKAILLLFLILVAGTSHALESHWGVGMGMVADRAPFTLAKLIFPLSHIYYEIIFPETKGLIAIGSYNFYGFIPVPELEIGVIIKDTLRIAVSEFYDIIFGGMLGTTVNASVIIDNFELKLISVIIYSQPHADYMDSFRQRKFVENINRNGDIPFPFFGIIFGLRF